MRRQGIFGRESPDAFARRVVGQLETHAPNAPYALRLAIVQAIAPLPVDAPQTLLESVAWQAYQEWLRTHPEEEGQ